MALALYRKYRPANFAEVVGQEHVTEPLMLALSNGRINHAYLFSGPRGCGKTSSARILARSLNCEQGPTPEPCAKCDSCVALAPDGAGSLDVIEIDAASHNGVEDARELRERAFYAPVSSRYKVYIVDEAHMVTPQAFNALLKLVEEPPDFVIFVFATTEPDKVLQTIRSRTHHYPFRLLPPTVIRGLLERICAQEKVVVAPAVYPLVVRAGGGSARDSLSILDQLLAGADSEGVSYSRSVALLGVTDAALLDETMDALAAQDGAAVFQAVDRVVEAGHDPRRFTADLLERLRDLVVLDAVPEAAAKGLLDHPADQIERMTDQAARLGTATLSRQADIVHAGLTEMRGTTSARLLLELVCARMLLPAASADSAALLQRLERMERRLDIGAAPSAPTAPAAPTPAPTAPPAPTPAPAAPPPTAGHPTAPAALTTVQAATGNAVPPSGGEVDAAAVRRVWPELLELVRGRKRTTEALLKNATVLAVDGGVLRLGTDSAPLMRMLSQEVHIEIVRLSLRDLLGVDWRIQTVVATPTLDSPEAAELDPHDDESMPGPDSPAPNRDPEAAAISLLESQLGARPIDPPP